MGHSNTPVSKSKAKGQATFRKIPFTIKKFKYNESQSITTANWSWLKIIHVKVTPQNGTPTFLVRSKSVCFLSR